MTTQTVTITARSQRTPLPAWAYMQRSLLAHLADAVDEYVAKYTDERGWLIWSDIWDQGYQPRDGVDDFYEAFYNFPVVYLLGGHHKFGDLALKHWHAVTEQLTHLGVLHKEYDRGYDQFHQSEGYLFFYYLCMALPDDARLREQAQRFAGFFLNEDLEAINYDPEHRILLAPHNGSGGARPGYFDGTPIYPYTDIMAPYGLPYDDVEGITTFDDLKDEDTARRMGEVMQARMGKGDVVTNLFVTGLITNAYLMTPDDERRARYRAWVQEYVNGWIERTQANGGLIPDNIGLNGQVGEYIDGKWYGGLYGWTWPHGWYNISYAAAIGAINAALITGDMRYMDFPRDQFQQARARGGMRPVDEQHMTLRGLFPNHLSDDLPEDAEIWQTPYRYGDQGWFDYHPLSAIIPVNLWSVSGAPEDRELIDWLKANSHYDWNRVLSYRTKEESGHEEAWVQFLRGENPSYPEAILHASLRIVAERIAAIRADDADLKQIYIHHWQLHNPIVTEALVQQIFGIPQPIYYGGLIIAPLFYADAEAGRPGLPPDVAALVEARDGATVRVHIVNTSALDTRRVDLYAGSLGQHRFTGLTVEAPAGSGTAESVPVDAGVVQIVLPPLSSIRLVCELQLYVNPPAYLRVHKDGSRD
jgi:hypothetical protein